MHHLFKFGSLNKPFHIGFNCSSLVVHSMRVSYQLFSRVQNIIIVKTLKPTLASSIVVCISHVLLVKMLSRLQMITVHVFLLFAANIVLHPWFVRLYCYVTRKFCQTLIIMSYMSCDAYIIQISTHMSWIYAYVMSTRDILRTSVFTYQSLLFLAMSFLRSCFGSFMRHVYDLTYWDADWMLNLTLTPPKYLDILYKSLQTLSRHFVILYKSLHLVFFFSLLLLLFNSDILLPPLTPFNSLLLLFINPNPTH